MRSSSRVVFVFVLGVLAVAAARPATAQSVPSTPETVISQVTGTSVALSWGASFPPPSTYVVEAGSAPGLTDRGTFSVGPVTALTVPGVPTGNYFVRVRAANAAGTSAATADIVVTVGGACQLPDPPIGLGASVAANAVSLQWAGAGPFRLVAGRAPGTSNVFAGDVGAATSLAASVGPGAYFVRVHALNACGLSLASNEVVLHVQVPEAPTDLASSVIGGQVRLVWTAPVAGLTPLGYVLEAGTGPGLADIATLPLAASPTRLDVGNVPAGTYYVRVRGAGSQAAGPPSRDLAFTVGAPLPGTTTVTFNALAGAHGTPLVTHSEQGLLVEPSAGAWTVLATYGRPAPAIQLVRTTSDPTLVGDVRLTAGGALFRLSSVDIYSSVTPIPYTLTGTRSGVPVFTSVGTVPNTFGNFATVANPDATLAVDTVVISVTNPAPNCPPTCGGNPVGLDNIVVWR